MFSISIDVTIPLSVALASGKATFGNTIVGLPESFVAGLSDTAKAVIIPATVPSVNGPTVRVVDEHGRTTTPELPEPTPAALCDWLESQGAKNEAARAAAMALAAQREAEDKARLERIEREKVERLAKAKAKLDDNILADHSYDESVVVEYRAEDYWKRRRQAIDERDSAAHRARIESALVQKRYAVSLWTAIGSNSDDPRCKTVSEESPYGCIPEKEIMAALRDHYLPEDAGLGVYERLTKDDAPACAVYPEDNFDPEFNSNDVDFDEIDLSREQYEAIIATKGRIEATLPSRTKPLKTSWTLRRHTVSCGCSERACSAAVHRYGWRVEVVVCPGVLDLSREYAAGV